MSRRHFSALRLNPALASALILLLGAAARLRLLPAIDATLGGIAFPREASHQPLIGLQR